MIRSGVYAIGFVALATSACSMHDGSSAQTAGPVPPVVESSVVTAEKGGARRQAVTVTGTVEDIDSKNRVVTVRGPDGKTEEIRVSEAARNLDQIERGDQVVVTYYESIAYEVLPAGTAKAGLSAQEGAAVAEPGEKPGGIAARAVTLVADVEELNRAESTAVLRGPDDRMITVHVQQPSVFDKVKVGDTVEITYSEALALDVQPAK